MINNKTFALAGNATFTVTSKKTGTRFTYKVEVMEDDPNGFFVKLLTGPDNWTNYRCFGTIRNGVFYHSKNPACPISKEAPSAKGFDFFWRHIDGGTFNRPGTAEAITLADCVEVHHEGKCCRCGRKLTVPSSIESGVGPECAAMMGL